MQSYEIWCQPTISCSSLDLLYLSTSFLWWQAVAGIIGGTSSHTQRNNSRCVWRHREGARNVDNIAIRRAFSPVRLCGSVTADVHGCLRGVAPLRHPLASRDTPVAHTGGATTEALHMPCEALPDHCSSVRLLAMASPHLDAR
jgi:hypothetical protein